MRRISLNDKARRHSSSLTASANGVAATWIGRSEPTRVLAAPVAIPTTSWPHCGHIPVSSNAVDVREAAWRIWAMNLEDHPTVRRLSRKAPEPRAAQPVETVLDAAWLRGLALDCGADDAGLVEIARPGLDPQREEILRNYPWTKSLLSLVLRMAREPLRGAPRSVANLEFHRAGHEVNEICAAIVAKLEDRGVRAVNPSMALPMEVYQTPGHAIWVVSHKPVAVEAGLGHMGIHRNLIHPKFGNFVLLGTVLIDHEASEYNRALDYNPCLECKLCVAACPVGAIGP